MKKFLLTFLFALMLLNVAVPIMSFAHTPSGPNLIANPSVEDALNDTTPTSWHNNSWGVNSATFTYQNSGNTGTRSLYTEVASYTSGDAKWYFEPVSIKPSTNYSFGVYYKSNISTEVVAQFTNRDGSNSYNWLGSVPASTTWLDKDFQLSTPSNAVKLSVFHVVASVGWLAVDDMSLTEVLPETVPPSSSLVPNESVETASANNPSLPAKWATNSWGNHQASFEYSNDANTGSKSVKTTISNYNNGDAKWYFEPISVLPNTQYVINDFYKSSTASHIVAVTYDGAGNPTYQDLILSAQASPNAWQSVSKSFTTPANAATLSIFHVIESNGWLAIDDMKVNPTSPPAPGENLITNPSLENGSASPQAWLSNSWGTNSAQFTYENSAHSGTKSVKTTVSSYTSGDAKWYFEPVVVNPGATYTYTHYYKSTSNTGVVAQYTDQNGTNFYVYLDTLSPSANWKAYSKNLVIPSNAVKLSVFHTVATVGTLSIDDAFLTPGTDPNPADNPVPNSSLETADASKPAQWNSSAWGSNTPVFQYLNEGRTGTKSVKVSLSNYQSGDAKWFFDPVTTLERGKQYRFSTWFKSNVMPQPVVLYVKDDGSEQYQGIPAPQTTSTTEWQYYTDTFSVPIDAQAVSVFLYINTNGWLQTDDYSITPYQTQGFNRPLVTLTFDDGHEQNTTTALPVMQQYGFKSTQCYATTFLEDADNPSSTVANAMLFKNAGHEICSHTVTHPFLSQMTSQQVDYELSHSKQYLESIFGVSVNNFASPFGDYNATVNQQIQQYYQSHRTVNEGYNSRDNFDPYQLRVQNVLSSTTLEEYQSWLNHAAATNTWLILVYHKVDNTGVGTYDSYLNDFQQQMSALNASRLTVKTYQSALDEVQPQL